MKVASQSMVFAIAALCVLADAGVKPVRAAEQCYSAQDLGAKAGEQVPVKGVHAYDEPPLPRKLVPFAPVPQNLRGAIRRVKLADPAKKLIALTFDLCEQPGEIAGYDGAIFDYLRAQNVKATFFAGGKWMRSHGARMQQIMADPRFEIANHSEAHRNLRLLSGAGLTEEILSPQRAFEDRKSVV